MSGTRRDGGDFDGRRRKMKRTKKTKKTKKKKKKK